MTGQQSLRALTIIELMIILCVLVLLAMIILPMRQDKRPSLLVRCLSNQRQIVLGCSMYADDTKSGFPNLDNLSGNDGPVAMAVITNYVKATNTFMCPFVVRERERGRPWLRQKFIPELNASFFRSNGNDYAYYDGLKLVSLSSTNALLADRFAWINRDATSNALFHARGKLNAVFTDGHGETLRSDKVVGASYDPPWSTIQDPLLRP